MTVAEPYDPYQLPPDAVREPPKSLGEAFKHIGPGIILAGTIVGSGELVLTTAIGARQGFLFLWLILFSCIIKVFVQVELGRYAISSGQPTLVALQRISSLQFIGGFLVLWWFLMMLCTVFQLGGMTGGVGQSMHLAIPQGSQMLLSWFDPIAGWLGSTESIRPELPWAFLTCAVTIALIYNGSYRRIEKLTTFLVVSLTLITVIAAVAICFTSYAPSLTEVLSGLTFRISDKGIPEAFAVFGITGVGATELFYYPYWCLEKGYARYTGLNDGSVEWEKRAKGWIWVMHLDAWTSMIVFTLSTVAFYFMGATVLHSQGLVPEGSKMIATLAQMFKEPFGAWTEWLFFIGAGMVLFKTLYLACAANSRMTVDFLRLSGLISIESAEQRLRWIKRFCIFFPILALITFLFLRDPQLLVRLGGFAQASTLPMIASATVYFSYRKVVPQLRPSLGLRIGLWIAWLSITVVAIYSMGDSIKQLFGSSS